MIYAFSDCTLDLKLFELRRAGVVRPLEPQVFDLLRYLIENRERVVTKEDLFETIWKGRIISDATLSSRIKAARQAIGDSGSAQALIQTLHGRGFRFVGSVTTTKPFAVPTEGDLRAPLAPTSDAKADHVVPPVLPPAPAAMPEQQIHFCRSRDGVQIAYSCIGNGPPLVKTGNWMTHLERDLKSPIWRHLWRDLALDHTLVRYDARGMGLSDWEVDEISFEAWVRDLEAVVDAVGVKEFDLLGISQGCGISIAYAARHPERVNRLVLYGGSALGSAKRSRSAADRDEEAAMLTLMRLGWGKENPAFRQMFTSQFVPDASKEQADWFNDLQRASCSPENAVRYRETAAAIDVSEILGKMTAPTLVMHARDEVRVPFENGRRLAAGIPGARFVALQSRNHLILEHEPAYPRFLEEIRSFLSK